MSACPCGSQRDYDDCCGPIIDGKPAARAELLMRSRYSAYVSAEFDHIEATHAPEVQGDFNRSSAEAISVDAKWMGLEIRGTSAGGSGKKYKKMLRRLSARK